MKTNISLTIFNLILITASIILFIFGLGIWNTGSFAKNILYNVILVTVFYILGWITLGLLYRFKVIRRQVKQRDVWISMIPNGVITLFLMITGVVSHLGFINLFISQFTFLSTIIIPFIFLGVTKI